MKRKAFDKKNGVTISKWAGHKFYKWRVTYSEEGRRKVKGFKTKSGKEGAMAFAERERGNVEKDGTRHASITDAERSAVIEFRNLKSSMPEHLSDINLADAVRDFSKHIRARHNAITCAEVADSYLTKLEAKNCSKRHIETATGRVKRFNSEYGEWLASDITTEIIDNFLIGLNLAPKTQANYRLALSGLFAHAKLIKATPSNPVEDAIRIKIKPVEAGVLTPGQVFALLNATAERTIPALAISFFAGLRRSEVTRLDWSQIDLEEGLIEVKAANSKTAQRRLVPISENLKQWLTPHEQIAGTVNPSPQIFRTDLEAAREDAGITDYPHNAARHSFASYHLAMHDDAGRLATSLGHPNPTMLYRHYRAIVKPKDAAAYWQITPEAGAKITNIKSA